MTQELTKRQGKILNILTQEYIKSAKPVSSGFLEKKCKLGISPATIRIELQKLGERGYISQPHTSAGRVPTSNGYRFFIDNFFSQNSGSFFASFVYREVSAVKSLIDDELKLAEELTKSLEEMSSFLNFRHLPEKDEFFEILEKIGPSKASYEKNINLINSLIKEITIKELK